MENIETLLAAVAQTQGYVDEESVPAASTSPERGSEHLKPPAVIEGDALPCAAVDVASPAPKGVEPVAGPSIGVGEKRKRGRPPKGQLRLKPPPPKRNKMVEDEEEEDVCFICFDGGSLVLCDRKGCPKAYHPTCIKRDEAFFRSKAKWNCGWHICSVCRKASYYMCYTCTFSLCKGCSKDTDYVRVRGNKGFCLTCMKTIMLIENKDQANNEIKVDFDDQTSWEYLFKIYWVALKEKLSLTLNDLTRAKSPRKGLTAVGYIPPRSILISASVNVDIPVIDSSMDPLELKPHVENNLPLPSYSNNVEKLNNGVEGDGPTKQSMDKVMQETCIEIEKDEDNINTTKDTDKPCVGKNTNGEEPKKPGVDPSTEWATKNLLEFIAHVKDGDVSAMSIFDVQTLLLDYINRNNLWDPHRKSQIKCDPLLESIFGKTCVGHIEMLTLLKSHILVKEDSQNNCSIPAGFVSSVRSDGEVDESVEDIKSGDSNKKDEYVKPGYLSYPQNGRKLNSRSEGKEESFAQAQDGMNGEADTGKSNSSDTFMNQENAYLSTNSTNDRDMQRSELETSTTTALVGDSPSPNVVEIEKLWHYRDPDGKIRGPFSMLQLRECSTTGLYAPDMRVWTNHEQYDSVFLTDALSGRFHGSSDLLNLGSGGEEMNTGEIKVISEGTIMSNEESKKIGTYSNDVSISSENDTGSVRVDKSGSWPQCWDLLTDNNNNHSNNSDVNDGHAHNVLPPQRLEEKHDALPDYGLESENFRRCEPQHGGTEENSAGLPQNPITSGHEVQNEYNNEDHVGPSAEEHVKSRNIDLSSNHMGLSKSPVSNKRVHSLSLLDFPSSVGPNADPPAQNTGFLELLSPAPRSSSEDHVTETKNPSFANFPVQISEMVDELCKFPFEFSLKPPETTFRDHPAATSAPDLPPPPQPQPNFPSWLASTNEPIEFDALGEDSVSDLLAEVDAMESQGAPHSPSVALNFAREFLEECRDDCFTSVEDFSAKNNALMRPGDHSAASSEGETNAPGGPVPGSGHQGAGPVLGSPDFCVEPGRGTVQGHINLVTVQGNVNLVLGGPTGWVSPGLGRGPIGGSMPWDGQWKYGGGERFASPRERPTGYQGVRAPWGRQSSAYGGGVGYQRSLPKGQRVCKFYESGHCKKGAFCDYLHP